MKRTIDMATKLNYLNDSFAFKCDATVQSTGRNEKGLYVVLDQTIAYPQGGGQPADRGFLIDNEVEIPLTFVGFQNGEVLHNVPESALATISVGKKYTVQIDPERRLNHARLHSGGHVVSHAMEVIEPSLIPIKGYHFFDGPYVEFINDRAIDVSRLLDRANALIEEMIAIKTQIRASYSNFEFIQRIRPHLAPFMPPDKPSRIVAIGDHIPLPCGGTHLSDLSQLGALRVTKTKRAKDNARVSYEVMQSQDGELS
jgi:Ser-tRNA(Ala) deacylase AlaX